MNIRQRVFSVVVAIVAGAGGSLVALAEPAAAATPACTTYRVKSGYYVPTISTGNMFCWMQRGHKGDGVRMLQLILDGCYGDYLDNIGFPSEVKADGDFGPITQRALMEVQHAEGIEDDGVYGVYTASTIQFLGNNAPCGYLN